MASFFPTVPTKTVPRPAHLLSREKLRPVALIVEDEPIITETSAAILDSNGLTAITATDGLQALETALAVPPEILITGLAMPGLDGLELAIRVTRAIPDCEVIITSSHASSFDLVERMRALGCDFAVLVRPVHPADLLDEVFRLLRKHGRVVNASEPFRNFDLYDSFSSARRAVRVLRQHSSTN
jgi:DNA-binding response OmpR family regulator